MKSPSRILIVGSGIAGVTVAHELRRHGYAGAITLIGEEQVDPYDRPPLSKQILSGAWAPSAATIATVESLNDLDVELFMGTAAASLDIKRRAVMLNTGREVRAEEVVIATGSHAFVPPGVELGPEVVALRTIDDSLVLADRLRDSRQLAVVGAGLLGLEVAATAHVLGVPEVTVYGASPPMQAVLGAPTSARLRTEHEEHGVRFELGERVTSARGPSAGMSSRASVHRPSGSVDADTVVVAVGARPSVSWLAGSGLPIGPHGVPVDARGRAVAGVHAAGEVCAWPDTRGRQRRIEHRTTASEQARAVALDLLGQDVRYEMVPFWWSDQYGIRLQGYGATGGGREEHVIAGDPNGATFAVAYGDGPRVSGVIGWNAAKATRVGRALVASGSAWPPQAIY